MSLPWSAQQREWLREMGFEVLARRDPAAAAPAVACDGADLAERAQPRDRMPPSAASIPPMLARAARGVDLAPLLAAGGPRDPASRRALWRALRPLRKAARAP